MVGNFERRSLVALIGTMIFVAPLAARAEESAYTLTLSAGLPSSSIEARLSPLDWLHLLPGIALVQTHALRIGGGVGATWLNLDPFSLSTELRLIRTIGLDVVDTWDVDVTQQVALRIGDSSEFDLRVGVVGYLGNLPSQRGGLGIGSIRFLQGIDEHWRLGVECGWMADPKSGIPLASLRLEHGF